MAKFRFRFQSVLHHRRAVENGQQRQVAELLRTRMILHDQLRQIQQVIRDSKGRLGDGLVGRVDVAAISRFAGYSSSLSQRAQQVVMRLSQLEDLFITAREKLLDATRRRKALELLRDRHRNAWQREQDRRETGELDELATQQFVRRAMEGVS